MRRFLILRLLQFARDNNSSASPARIAGNRVAMRDITAKLREINSMDALNGGGDSNPGQFDSDGQ